jgi:hypothetical protein
LATLLALAAGCKKSLPPRPPPAQVAPPPSPAHDELPARGVGMDDPFARMSAEAVQALEAGYAALRGRKYVEAARAFAAVVAALPDHTAARFQQLRATALAGRFDELPVLWRDLLVRDLVGYAGRLDRPTELAPLRASPVWRRLRDIERTVRPAYAAGMAGKVFFVARTRAGAAPRYDQAGTARLPFSQEVYHYDLATRRYRRITETGGRVFALAGSPDGDWLALLLVPALARLTDGQAAFRDPEGARVRLDTLEITGRAPLGAAGFTARQVTLCLSSSSPSRSPGAARGEPRWQVPAPSGADRGSAVSGGLWGFDATGSALVRFEGESCAPGNQTQVTPETIRHLGPDDPGLRLSEAGDRLEIAGVDRPLRSARPIDAASIVWAPGRRRIAWAGLLDPCRVKREGPGSQAIRNELYVYDLDKKRPQRIASAISKFDSGWLDDGHLLYEGGVGGAGRLLVYDLGAGSSEPLKPCAGAGLYGFPLLACDDEHEGEEPEEAMAPEPSDDDDE